MIISPFSSTDVDNKIQYGYIPGQLITKNIAGYPVYGATGAAAVSPAHSGAGADEAAVPIAATSINDYVVPSAGGGTGIGIFAPGYLITAPGGYDTLIPMIQKFRAII